MAFPTTPTAAISGAKEPCAEVPNRHRGCAYMTQDEIIEMAVRAGMAKEIAEVNIDIIERFAQLVAQAERKAIAEADRATELLERCENEMRYAGWTKYEADNFARNGVYEQVKQYLEKNA